MLNQDKSSSNSVQLCLAIIGLIGTLGGAVIANWDKIVPQPAAPSAKPLTSASVTSAAIPIGVPTEVKDTHQAVAPPVEVQLPQQGTPSVGPSFDCAKATYRSERLICSSPDLAVLDLAMANAYRDAAARVGTRERKAALRDIQNHWLRRIREACDNTDCLRDAYEQRIGELKAVQP